MTKFLGIPVRYDLARPRTMPNKNSSVTGREHTSVDYVDGNTKSGLPATGKVLLGRHPVSDQGVVAARLGALGRER